MNTILQTNIVRCLTQIAHSSMYLHKGLARVAKKYFSISRKHLCTESKNIKMSYFTYENNQSIFRLLEVTFCVFCKGWKLCSLAITTKWHFQRIQLLITTSIFDSPYETSHGIMGSLCLVLGRLLETSERLKRNRECSPKQIRNRDGVSKKKRVVRLEARRFTGFKRF